MKPICKIEQELVIPSPVEQLTVEWLNSKNITLYIKRDDLIHPEISGNKWRKLKYNLNHALENKLSPLISFGGAFSNHIYALSAAAEEINIPTIGIIRGKHVNLKNPTLQFAAKKSMRLITVDQAAYRLKESSAEVQALLKAQPNAMCIPEGGSNPLATKGTAEITTEIIHQLGKAPDHIILAAGTGATAAGVISSSIKSTKVWVINALKNESLQSEISSLLEEGEHNFEVLNEYHQGGFAKTNPFLIKYINDFKSYYGLQLEPIYTGKMMMALEALIKTGLIENESTVVAIHTGGLQGILGHNERYKNRVEMQISID